jgi:hypothetical protein
MNIDFVIINPWRINMTKNIILFKSIYIIFGLFALFLEENRKYSLLWHSLLTFILLSCVSLADSIHILLRINKYIYINGMPQNPRVEESDLHNFFSFSKIITNIVDTCFKFTYVALLTTMIFLLSKIFPNKIEMGYTNFFRVYTYILCYIFFLLIVIITISIIIACSEIFCHENIHFDSSRRLDTTNEQIIRYLHTFQGSDVIARMVINRLHQIDNLRLTRSSGFCAICQTHERGIWRVLPCHEEHRFHVDCIDAWLMDGNRCPICRINPVNNPVFENIPNLNSEYEFSTSSMDVSDESTPDYS